RSLLMIRRPPRATLVPSTPLFRSPLLSSPVLSSPILSPPLRSLLSPVTERRSEEHTSELQSHLNLVCRHLLDQPHRRRPTATASLNRAYRPARVSRRPAQ